MVGWEGATDAHPVAKEVLAAIGTGARGTAIHKTLKAPPYGWPQDAIDAVLIALHRGGHLRSTRNGQPVSAGALDQAAIKAAEFRLEKVRLTTSQRIALRGLFAKLEINAKSGEEEICAPEFLGALAELRRRAGGAAPLPSAPDSTSIDDLKHLAGSEQLAALYAGRNDVEKWIEIWTVLAERTAARLPVWERAAAFRRHAEGLPVAAEVDPEIEAIRQQRSLLAETDQIGPLVSRLAAALRQALAARHAELSAAIEAACAALSGDATWLKLDAAARERIRGQTGLKKPPPLTVATDEDLLRALDARPLEGWQSAIDAVDPRTGQALQAAVDWIDANTPSGDADSTGGTTPPALRRTTTVHVRRGTLADEAAVREWLQEQEQNLVKAVRNGPVIVQ